MRAYTKHSFCYITHLKEKGVCEVHRSVCEIMDEVKVI